MPGYDRSRIVGVAEDDLQEFICGICLEVFVKPTVAECCGQTFCYDCITEWLERNNTCPNDRKRLSQHQLKSTPKLVTNLLNKMKIKCDFTDNGCESVVRINELDTHKQFHCLYNPFRDCEKCGLSISNHTDQLCVHTLFNKVNELSNKLDTLQKEHELLIESKSTYQIETEAYIGDLLAKITHLESKCNNLEGRNAQTGQNMWNNKPRVNNFSLNPDVAPYVPVRYSGVESPNEKYVRQLSERYNICESVAHAMKKINRANYSPDPFSDTAVHIGFGVNISAGQVHAKFLQLLEDKLTFGAKALDVGSGSGYVTACMAYMVGPLGTVIGLEKIREAADLSIENIRKDFPQLLTHSRINVLVRDGREGYPLEAPYDVIHVGAAARTVPQPLIDQLKTGGRLLITIMEDDYTQVLKQIDKMQDSTIRIRNLPAEFSFSTFLD